MRTQEVGNSARLRVDHQQSGEGNEIEQITTSPAQHESGDQQREQVAVRRQPEPEQPNRDPEREDQTQRREQRRAAIQVLARWAPLLGGLAVVLAVLVRLPFWKAPLTADEGGYAEVARLWSHGATLYGGAWVDRPQGLVIVFRALHLIGGSPFAMRATAAVVAALVVAATMLLTLRLARGRITAVTAGLLAATVGASPFIESFTLSGELLASLPAVLSLLCFCRYLDGRERAGSSNRLLLSLVGAIGGGNFHPHYYLQLVPPLSLLAAVGVRKLWLSAPRPAIATAGAAAAATLALTIPVAWATPTEQAQAIWPADPHLVHDAVLARYVRAHTRPRERILAVWADADLYYLADRRPAARYLWSRNVASIPGALEAVHHALATRRAELVLVVQPPATLDPSGRTAALLRREYHRVAHVGGASVYRRKSQSTAT